MAKQDIFQVCWTGIVCLWSLQQMFVVSSAAVIKEKPVIYPEDESISNQIPEKLLIAMSKIQNQSQMQEFFGPLDSVIGEPLPTTATGETDYSVAGDRKKLSGKLDISRGASCEPELQTVELEKPEHLAHVYWPMCVRTFRCGGCCTSALLTCTPVKTSKVEAKVLHARYLSNEDGGQFDVMGMKLLTVEKHDKCTCRCREQPEDCTEFQVYKEEECKCMCTNKEDMEKCSGANWFWDSKDCTCKCSHVQECSSGFFYNGQSCRCESNRASLFGKRKFPSTLDVNATLEQDLIDALGDDEAANVTDDTITGAPTTTTISTEATTTPTTTAMTTTTGKIKRGRIARPIVRTVIENTKPNEPIHIDFRLTKDTVPFTLDTSKDKGKKVKIEGTITAT